MQVRDLYTVALNAQREAYGGHDLQFDVNLLTSVFPGVVADALDRALSQRVHIAPMAEEETGLAAKAG